MNIYKNKHKILLALVLFSIFILIIEGVKYLNEINIPILNPKGPIALKEYHLIVGAALISLIVIIPVFILAFLFVFNYRETKNNPSYSPNKDGNKFLETIWWVVPTILITVLSVITYKSTYSLDPNKSIISSNKVVTIQVIAMNWKWLFIYPNQNIATINYVNIPTNSPVNFQITSDAPMNSFWIPQLSGQIYAMPGMNTQLNLLASSNGTFDGSSANISGNGFSSMDFKVNSLPNSSFNYWVNQMKFSDKNLTLEEYNKLSTPSVNNIPANYRSVQYGLYNTVINRYMMAPEGKINVDGNSDSKPLTTVQSSIMNMHGVQSQ